jgi:hypothetical protein
MAEMITVRRVTRDGGLRKVLKGISSSLGPVTKYTFLSGRALHRRRLGPWVRRKSGITVLLYIFCRSRSFVASYVDFSGSDDASCLPLCSAIYH